MPAVRPCRNTDKIKLGTRTRRLLQLSTPTKTRSEQPERRETQSTAVYPRPIGGTTCRAVRPRRALPPQRTHTHEGGTACGAAP